MKKQQLQSLTKEQKIEMYEAIQERKRRKKLRRENFAPNSGQMPVIEAFCNDNIETILVTTGNGGGKTALGCNLAVDSALGYIQCMDKYLDVPAKVVVVLDKPEKVTDVWLPEMKKWFVINEDQLSKRGKPYVTQVEFANLSEITFMFHEQDPMSFESIEGDVFIFDEPPPRHIFVSLRRAGRKKGRKPKYLVICTPIGASWLRTELHEPWLGGERPDIAFFRFATHVNETNLAEGYVEKFAQYLSEKERRIRLEGEFFDIEGLALGHLWKDSVHIVKRGVFSWDPAWPCVIAIDPHGAKPHHAVLLGCDPDGSYVVLGETKSRLIPREFAKHLWQLWGEGGYRVVDLICDSYGKAELSGGEGNKSFIQVINEEFEAKGWRARSTTYDEKSDEVFINKIQEVLAIPTIPDNMARRLPKLRVFEDCYGSIKDIKNVEWEKYKYHDIFKPRLAIANRDFLACIKYALTSNFSYGRERGRILRGSLRNPNRFRYGATAPTELQYVRLGRRKDEDDW